MSTARLAPVPDTLLAALEAVVGVPNLKHGDAVAAMDDSALAEAFIVASVTRGDGIGVTPTEHHKCGRCWRHLLDVAADGALCGRCADVLGDAA